MNLLCLFFILQCKCWPGFQLKDDGKTCVDVDECSLGFPCSQQCINTYGTYRCLCTDGYEIQPNNPNGCKSLSGIELNLSTESASVTHMDLIFQLFLLNSFLIAVSKKSKFSTYLDMEICHSDIACCPHAALFLVPFQCGPVNY